MRSPLWQKGKRGDFINDNLLHIFFTTARHSRKNKETWISALRVVDLRGKDDQTHCKKFVIPEVVIGNPFVF